MKFLTLPLAAARTATNKTPFALGRTVAVHNPTAGALNVEFYTASSGGTATSTVPIAAGAIVGVTLADNYIAGSGAGLVAFDGP